MIVVFPLPLSPTSGQQSGSAGVVAVEARLDSRDRRFEERISDQYPFGTIETCFEDRQNLVIRKGVGPGFRRHRACLRRHLLAFPCTDRRNR